MVKKINSSEFEQVKNNKAIIVDFSAEWCGPCKMLAPVMEQLSDEITDVAVRLPVSRLVLCLRMI